MQIIDFNCVLLVYAIFQGEFLELPGARRLLFANRRIFRKQGFSLLGGGECAPSSFTRDNYKRSMRADYNLSRRVYRYKRRRRRKIVDFSEVSGNFTYLFFFVNGTYLW